MPMRTATQVDSIIPIFQPKTTTATVFKINNRKGEVSCTFAYRHHTRKVPGTTASQTRMKKKKGKKK